MSNKILVIGDVMIDEYAIGVVERISPEAPVPILVPEKLKYGPGGAANSALQVAALGLATRLVSVVGNSIIDQVVAPNEQCCLVDYLLGVPGVERKRRYINSTEQLLRVDYVGAQASEASIAELIVRVRAPDNELKGLLVSDYGKGVVEAKVLQAATQVARDYDVFLTLDSKQTTHDLETVDVAVPNLKEAQTLTGLQDPELAAELLSRKLRVGVIVTLGAQGAVVASKSRIALVAPVSVATVDAVGAGDSVAAATSVAMSRGADLFEAARFAMKIAAHSTTALGTSVPASLC